MVCQMPSVGKTSKTERTASFERSCRENTSSGDWSAVRSDEWWKEALSHPATETRLTLSSLSDSGSYSSWSFLGVDRYLSFSSSSSRMYSMIPESHRLGKELIIQSNMSPLVGRRDDQYAPCSDHQWLPGDSVSIWLDMWVSLDEIWKGSAYLIICHRLYSAH